MEKKSPPTHKSHPLVDLFVSILIPSYILMKLSGESALGASGALIAALALPVVWGIWELVKYRKYNFIAILGIVSVLLTGGIGLLNIDTQWIAVKEAAIPGLIAIAVLISARMRHPFVRTLLVNPAVIDVEKIYQKLSEHNAREVFEERLVRATYFLSGTFFFSSAMNYILAKWIVVSPTGSAAFNLELGRLALMSYPMIALPSMVMMLALLYYLWKTIRILTGLTLEEVIVSMHPVKVTSSLDGSKP